MNKFLACLLGGILAYATSTPARANLQDAVDNTDLAFTTGYNSATSNSVWFRQTTVHTDGSDAARSGPIAANQATWMETEVTGPGTVTFQWRVSSSGISAGGPLVFMTGKPTGPSTVEWLNRAEIRGEVAWNARTFTVPTGRHFLRWQYQKGSGSAAGEDAGWVDQVRWTPSAAVSLAQAVDTTGLTWTTSGTSGVGDNQWFGTTLESADGQDSARTPIMGADQSTWMETEVTGPGTVTFQWKVSSSGISAGAPLLFSTGKPTGATTVEWLTRAEIRGEVAWETRSYTVPAGRHFLRWEYRKGSASDSGEDAGWVDYIRWLPSSAVTLAQAVDAAGLNWTTSGSAGVGDNQWFGTTLESADGQDAARTPIMGAEQSTWMETQVTGPGTVTFQWKVSSSGISAGAPLFFSTGKPTGPTTVEWLTRAEIRGEVAWATRSFTVPAGRHFLRWQYQKGSASDGGEDAGWVDQVRWFPSSTVPLAQAVDATGLSWTTSGTAGTGLNQWFGTTLESADGQDAARTPIMGANQLTYLETEVTGPGTVNFQWKVSSSGVSAGAPLLFRTGEITGPTTVDWLTRAEIRGEVAWNARSFTVPAGRHLLRWQYQKGSASAAGEDAGWVDQVNFIPDNLVTSPSIHTLQSAYAFSVMQGASGSLLIPISNFGTQPLTISQLTFSAPWGTASTTSPSIGGRSSGNILFTASAAGLSPGTYNGTLEIQSNAPASPVKSLTVSIMVFSNELGATDSDSDGLPDAYEIAHGLDLTRDDSEEDSDGDGFSNFVEFLYGSSPSQATLQPDVDVTISLAIEILIPTVAGTIYQIQSTEALGSGVWSNIGAPIIGDGAAARRYFSGLGKTKDFYRVKVN